MSDVKHSMGMLCVQDCNLDYTCILVNCGIFFTFFYSFEAAAVLKQIRFLFLFKRFVYCRHGSTTYMKRVCSNYGLLTHSFDLYTNVVPPLERSTSATCHIEVQ